MPDLLLFWQCNWCPLMCFGSCTEVSFSIGWNKWIWSNFIPCVNCLSPNQWSSLAKIHLYMLTNFWFCSLGRHGVQVNKALLETSFFPFTILDSTNQFFSQSILCSIFQICNIHKILSKILCFGPFLGHLLVNNNDPKHSTFPLCQTHDFKFICPYFFQNSAGRNASIDVVKTCRVPSFHRLISVLVCLFVSLFFSLFFP